VVFLNDIKSKNIRFLQNHNSKALKSIFDKDNHYGNSCIGLPYRKNLEDSKMVFNFDLFYRMMWVV